MPLFIILSKYYKVSFLSQSTVSHSKMDESQKNPIKVNEYILLVDNRKQQRLIRPADNRQFKWRKINIKLAELGQFEYYENIEVGNDKLVRSEDQYEQEEELDEEEEQEQVFNSNNKEIYTLEAAQKLQPEQIHQLKATKNANQIIDAIVSNNEQFGKRTAYSKEKYLAKKKRKYLFRFHAEEPTLENVHNYYFNDEPKSIGFIRWDMFGFMLLQGGPYQTVLLAEKTKGLFLGSLLQRQAKQITVCCEQAKNVKRFPIVEQLNISKQKVSQIVQFCQWKEAVENKHNTKYTNLLIAGNYNFEQIVQKMQAHLAPGCIICLHCQNLQPLQAALAYMKSNSAFIHMKLFDMWARHYQVLKNRTHPLMYMPSHSGYVLTGLKVQ